MQEFFQKKVHGIRTFFIEQEIVAIRKTNVEFYKVFTPSPSVKKRPIDI